VPVFRVEEEASLDYYAPSSSQSSWRPCPNRLGRQALNVQTGVLFPASCGRLHCYVCVRAEAFRYSRAIGVVAPTQSILLTRGGLEWPATQKMLNRFRAEIRKKAHRYEDVAHVERNLWGDELDHDTVHASALLAGFGDFAGVEPVRTGTGRALAYGLKTLIAGSNEGPDLPATSQDYLELNGGRLAHATKRFWRDADGRPVKGWREAAKLFQT
jgi:hypothetical protein